MLESHRKHNKLLDVLERTFDGHRELRASHERLDEFAGQVSHELQGPLASIELILEMLEREGRRAATILSSPPWSASASGAPAGWATRSST